MRENKMKVCFSIGLVLFVFAISFAYAQAYTGAAAQNSWNVAGMFSLHYLLPVQEDDYEEEGALVLNINPRVLWFAIDGFGVGVATDFYYFTGNFKHMAIGIGPHVAYYLKRPGILSQLMPYAGCSFQFLRSEMDPGSTETGWNLKLGLGISPIFGDHVTVPIELGYMAHHLSSDYGEENYSHTSRSIYLECGIGAFLW